MKHRIQLKSNAIAISRPFAFYLMQNYFYRRLSEFKFIFLDTIIGILKPQNATNLPYILSASCLLKARWEQKNELGSGQ